jgi:hypothetical protein
MTKITLFAFAAALLALILIPNSVQAQSRVFVAAQGSDGNPCTFASPCRTFQHAHNVVAANGEIDVLDPAGYGALTITHAISIQGHGFSGISAPSGNAITINAGASDVINLRGLLFDGVGSGSTGIEFNTGASVNIQNSIIRNFATFGIRFQPTAAGGIVSPTGTSRLSLSQTLVSDLGTTATAVAIVPVASGSAIAVVENVRLDNGGIGLLADGHLTTGILAVTVLDSVISNYANSGIRATTFLGTTVTMVRNCTVTNSNLAVVTFGTAFMRLMKSTITWNGTGIEAFDSSSIVSTGDNLIVGNNGDGLPTSAVQYR